MGISCVVFDIDIKKIRSNYDHFHQGTYTLNILKSHIIIEVMDFSHRKFPI